MPKLLVIAFIALFAVGCATYEPKPLDPKGELAALSRLNLTSIQVQRAELGKGLSTSTATAAFDPSDGLDDAELVSVALTHNPELRSRRLEVGEAEALLITAGLWPNPEVGVGWRPPLGGAPGVAVDADLLFELLRPWERSAREGAATARIEEVNAAIVAEEWRVVAETRAARVAVLVAEQLSVLLDQETKLRERSLDLSRRRRDVGDGTELDVTAAELELVDVRRDRRRALTELESARRALNRILGLPPALVLPLTGAGQPLSFELYEDLSDEELDRRLLAGRFELRAKEAAYRRAEEELRLAVYKQYPRLKIGPSYDNEPEGDHYLGVGASLELPIFDRNQGEIAEKQTARERVRAEYTALLLSLRANAFEARGQLRRARIEVEAQEREVLPVVRRAQALSEAAFHARELGVFEWATAQRRGLAARREFLESMVRYRRAVIDLEAASGMSLSQPVGAEPPKKDTK